MGTVTRRIGLSLGADICWPLCYEELVQKLDLSIPWKGDTLRFDVERVTIEPYDLRQPCKYDLVIDRLTHGYHTSRAWIFRDTPPEIVVSDQTILGEWQVTFGER